MKKLTLTSLYLLVFFSTVSSQGQYSYKNKGYFNLSGISYYGITRMEEDYLKDGIDNLVTKHPTNHTHGVSVQTVNGWFLGPYVSAGIGVGYDYYSKPKLSTFPIFFDLRIYLSNGRNSFFLYGDIGTVLGSTKTYYIKSGIFTAGLGYKFFIGDKHSLTASIGLDGKSFAKSAYQPPNPVHAFVINSTIISIGYLF
ncbi:MAG: hypothetical protein B6I20_14200 [Bacteroidetes bacterium 4572_117]|nr:MAG: hypothetical protein B6I20_14200 [Bacteroidetes bacterium 4572_117]